ncbi:MAG TPA: 23S rRNA (pseudouridine(1915)-N(3))-methyltransferase RlmH [Syntrophobacteria bacterium]|nr:23S rRNA (pseudouridine(1915)-N(3))-methyltransferase RlmH [Syntrophobacteria bacterium]
MKIHLIFVGKIREAYLREGIEDYLARLRHYVPVKVTVVRAEPVLREAMGEEAIGRESDRVEAEVDSGCHLVVLDRLGKQMGSDEFARWWAEMERKGCRELVFAVGGALGFSDRLRRRADTLLSLGRMTFTHEMSRLVLLEQLYRARTILRGEKYHK